MLGYARLALSTGVLLVTPSRCFRRKRIFPGASSTAADVGLDRIDDILGKVLREPLSGVG